MQQLDIFEHQTQEYQGRPNKIKLVSWNVNSIRARKEQVKDWLKRESPDIVCLQETKVRDEDFPTQDFIDLGYNIVVYGEPKYNGVAILSKFRIEDVVKGFKSSPDSSARVISGRILDLIVYNVYAPNAQSLQDRTLIQKVNWYKKFIEYIKKNHSCNESLLF